MYINTHRTFRPNFLRKLRALETIYNRDVKDVVDGPQRFTANYPVPPSRDHINRPLGLPAASKG